MQRQKIVIQLNTRSKNITLITKEIRELHVRHKSTDARAVKYNQSTDYPNSYY